MVVGREICGVLSGKKVGRFNQLRRAARLCANKECDVRSRGSWKNLNGGEDDRRLRENSTLILFLIWRGGIGLLLTINFRMCEGLGGARMKLNGWNSTRGRYREGWILVPLFKRSLCFHN